MGMGKGEVQGKGGKRREGTPKGWLTHHVPNPEKYPVLQPCCCCCCCYYYYYYYCCCYKAIC